MSASYPAIPGVPSAGHVSRGAWHPGSHDGCPKCEPDDDRPGAPYPPIAPSTAQRIRDRLARANQRADAYDRLEGEQ